MAKQLTSARVLLGQIQEKQLASQQQVQRQTAAQAELAEQIERLGRSAEAVEPRRRGRNGAGIGRSAGEASLVAAAKGSERPLSSR